MFKRKRRRPRVSWLPVPGQLYQPTSATPNALEPRENPGVIEFSFPTDFGGPQTVIAPMVVDEPVSESFIGATLDVWREGTLNLTQEFGYRLRRIVGDIFVAAFGSNDQATNPGGAFVTAGIMVLKVGSDGISPQAADDLAAGNIQNNSDPYIWRRSWLLSEQLASGNVAQQAVNKFPATNTAYGTKWAQGVDQKTARRIGPEERLFFIMSAWVAPLSNIVTGPDNSADSGPQIYCLFDYRVLGSVFTSAGNRRNASR